MTEVAAFYHVPAPVTPASVPPSMRVEVDWQHLYEWRPLTLRLHKTLPKYLLLPEIHVILDAATLASTHFYLNTLWHTGARANEALALKPGDFKIESPTKAYVALQTLKQRTGKRGAKDEGRGGRLVPLRDPSYIAEVRSYLATHATRADRTIFDVTYAAMEKRLRMLLAGLAARGWSPGVPTTLHTFRHSFAINMVLHGRPTTVLKAWLGHRRIETTEVYTQILTADTAHLMDGIAF